MAWFGDNFRDNFKNITGQLSDYAKDVLTEGTEEVSDHTTELRMAHRKTYDLEAQVIAHKTEVDRLKSIIGELEEKSESSELQINTMSTQYREMLLEKENEIKQLKQKHHAMQDFHDTMLNATSLNTSTSTSMLTPSNVGVDDEDFQDVISSQYQINKLSHQLQRVQVECEHWKQLSNSQTTQQTTFQMGGTDISLNSDEITMLKSQVKDLEKRLANEIDEHQHELTTLQDVHSQKMSMATKRHKQDLEDYQMRIEELESQLYSGDEVSEPNDSPRRNFEELRKLRSKKNELENVVEQVERRVSQLESINQQLKKELKASQNGVKEKEACLVDVQQQIKDLKEQYNAVLEDGQNLEQDKQKLMKEFQNLLEEHKTLTHQLEENNKTLQEQNEELNQLRNTDVTALQQQLEETQAELKQVKEEKDKVSGNKTAVASLEAANAQVRDQTVDIVTNIGSSEHQEITGEIMKSLEDENELLKVQIKKLESFIEELENSNAVYLDEKKTLEDAISMLNKQLESRASSELSDRTLEYSADSETESMAKAADLENSSTQTDDSYIETNQGINQYFPPASNSTQGYGDSELSSSDEKTMHSTGYIDSSSVASFDGEFDDSAIFSEMKMKHPHAAEAIKSQLEHFEIIKADFEMEKQALEEVVVKLRTQLKDKERIIQNMTAKKALKKMESQKMEEINQSLVNDLQIELEKLQQKIAEYEDCKQELISEKNEIKAQLRETSAKYEINEKSYNDLMGEKNRLLEKYKELESNYQEVLGKMTDMEGIKQSLVESETDKDRISQELDLLNEKLSTETLAVCELSEEKTVLQDKLMRLEVELENIGKLEAPQHEITSLKEELAAAKKEISSHNKTKDKFTAQFLELRKNLEDSSAANDDKDEQLNDLNDQLEAMETRAMHLVHETERMKEREQNIIEQFTQQIKDTEETVEEMQQQMVKCQKENDFLTAELQLSNGRLLKQAAEYESMINELRSQEEQEARDKAALQKAEIKGNQLKSEDDSSNTANDTSQNDIKNELEDEEESSTDDSELTELKTRCAELEYDAKETKEILTKTLENQQQMTEMLKDKENDIKLLAGENSFYQGKLEDGKQKIHLLEQEIVKLSAAQEELLQLKEKYSELEIDLKQMSELEQEIVRLKAVEEELHQMKEKHSMLDSEVKQMKALQQQVDKLKATEEELHQLKEKHSKLEVEFNEMKEKESPETKTLQIITNLESEIGKLKMEVKKTKKDIQTKEELITDLKKRISEQDIDFEKISEKNRQQTHQIQDCNNKLAQQENMITALNEKSCENGEIQNSEENGIEESKHHHSKPHIGSLVNDGPQIKQRYEEAIQEKLNEIKMLKEDNIALSKLLEDNRAYSDGESVESEYDISRLEVKVNKLEDERNQMMSVLNEKTRECSNLKNEVHRLMKVASEGRIALQKLQQDNAVLNKSLEGPNNDMHKEALQNLARIVQDKDLELEAMTQKMESLQMVLQQMQPGDTAEIDKLLHTNSQLQKQNSTLQSDREQLIVSLTQKHQESVGYYEEVQRLMEVIATQKQQQVEEKEQDEIDGDNVKVLEDKYKNLHDQYEQLSNEYQDGQLRQQELQDKYDNLLQSMNDKEHSLEEVKTKLLHMQNDLAQLELTREELLSKVNNAELEQSSVEHLQLLNKEKETEIAHLQNENERLKMQVDAALNVERESLQGASSGPSEVESRLLEAKETELVSLKKQLTYQAKNMLDKDELVKKFTQENVSLKQTIAQNTKNLQENVRTITTKTDELAGKEELIRTRSDELCSLKQKCDLQNKKIQEQDQKIKFQNDEIHVLKEQIAQVEADKINVEQTVRQNHQEITKFRHQVDIQNKQLQEKDNLLRNKIDELRQCTEQLRVKEGEYTTLLHQTETLSHRLKAYNEEINTLKQERTNQGKFENQRLLETQKLQETISRMSSVLQEKDFEIGALREKSQTLTRLVQEREQGSLGEIQTVRHESEVMQQQALMFQQERDHAIMAYNQQQSNFSVIQQELISVQEKEQRARKELDRLRQHLLQIEESYTKEALLAEDREKELRTKLAEAEDKVYSSAVQSASQEVSKQVESLQEELHAIASQRDQAVMQLAAAQEQTQQYAASLNNLQMVLEQFQQERESVYSAEMEKYHRIAREHMEKSERLEKQNADLQTRMTAATEALDSASRLTDQLDRKDAMIQRLKQEVNMKEEELHDIQSRVARLMGNGDSKVDKSLVKNLFVGYFSTPKGKQGEVLRLISRVLNFTQNEMEKVGLSSGEGSWLTGWFRKASPSPPSSPNRSNAADESFTKSFVSFLQFESTPTAQVKLPLKEMMQERSSRPAFNPFTVPPLSPSSPKPKGDMSHILMKPVTASLPAFTPMPIMEKDTEQSAATSSGNALKEILQQ
uniref:Thyroid receptor-interacting protein 11-like n=1 Tax=Saccoglossus kowalevskii TaxID=10224 RepID=A0ABM0MAJ5_SACKO|nr:PREDICTED: thyroid receptor-interacting protein 11-like [Saccoglossus kowalevskii]